ncbi:MAG TPA: tetratricopeptide repeat protein, partial [Candidatus Polarisedimenticolaceae bacterium]|nr:tetratricopeptide repeat protein [Candidatus Polarisedimenticolaceae bacterium]
MSVIAGTILVAALLGSEGAQSPSDVAAATAEITGFVEADRRADAETAAQRWLERMEHAHGPDSLEVARVVDLYVTAARSDRTPPRPELVPLARRAVRIKEAVFGRTHVEVADSLSRLASMQTKNGDPASAETTLRRAIAVREKASGTSGAALADNFHQLAQAQFARGRLDEAIASIARAVAALDAPESQPKLACWIYTIQTSLLERRGRFAEARAAAERALAFVQRTLPETSQEVCDTYVMLAQAEKLQGDLAASQRHYERAVELASRDPRPDGPNVVAYLVELAILRLQQGEFADTRATLERAIALGERLHGPSAEQTLSARRTLGTFVAADGRLDEAAAIYEDVLARCTRPCGSEFDALVSLGDIELDRRRPAQARRALERARELAVAQHGVDSKETGEVEIALGGVNCLTGDALRARSLFDRGIAKIDEGYGRESEQAAYARFNAGTGLLAASEFATAAALMERAIDILGHAPGPDEWVLPDIFDGLAQAYVGSGDYGRARDAQRRAVSIQEQALGPNDAKLAVLLGNLASIEMRMGAAAPALVHVTRALSIQAATGVSGAGMHETLAFLRWLGGRPQEALDEALIADADLRDDFHLVARELSEREALHIRGQDEPPRDVALTVVAGTPALARGAA